MNQAKNIPKLDIVKQSLESLGDLEVQSVFPTLCAPYDDDLSSLGFERVVWAPYVWQGTQKLSKEHELITSRRVFSIGLASVLTCLQLDLSAGDKVLDMCAAPGIKSLYLQILYKKSLDVYVNDISHPRLVRLRRLFDDFKIPTPTFTNQPGQTLAQRYKRNYFDAVVIDAPCSGEGNIFAGDTEALESWSQAKVRRLAQLQRKLLITGSQLLKHDGVFVYATCTLNQYENEKSIKKAGFSVENIEVSSLENLKLSPRSAYRILPSKISIGFFVATLDAEAKIEKTKIDRYDI